MILTESKDALLLTGIITLVASELGTLLRESIL